MTENHWSAEAIALFFSYSSEDEALRKQLATRLKPMERKGIIQSSSSRDILPGSELRGKVDRQLEAAQIILLLISPDFLASDYCYVQMERALERHEAKDACVIPILLRPVDNLEGMPFGTLRVLPQGNNPVTQWSNTDEAFVNIAHGIRAVVESWQSRNTESGGTIYFNSLGQQRMGASNQDRDAQPSSSESFQRYSQADQDLIDSLRQQRQGIKRQLNAVSEALLGASAAEEIRLEAQRDSLARKLKSIDQRRQELGDDPIQ